MVDRDGLENRCTLWVPWVRIPPPPPVLSGEVTEWLKARDWKSRVGDEPTEGSNPSLSAT